MLSCNGVGEESKISALIWQQYSEVCWTKNMLHIHIFHVKLHDLRITNTQLSEVQFAASTQTRKGRRIRQEERWRVDEK